MQPRSLAMRSRPFKIWGRPPPRQEGRVVYLTDAIIQGGLIFIHLSSTNAPVSSSLHCFFRGNNMCHTACRHQRLEVELPTSSIWLPTVLASILHLFVTPPRIVHIQPLRPFLPLPLPLVVVTQIASSVIAVVEALPLSSLWLSTGSTALFHPSVAPPLALLV